MTRRNSENSLARDRLVRAHTDRLLLDATVDELIKLALQAGVSIRDLNALLDSGLGLDELVDFVATKLLRRAA